MGQLRKGFKAEANRWSRDLRQELGIRPASALSPWMLSEHLEIPVTSLSDYAKTHPAEVALLTATNGTDFSAATVFYGLRRLIVHNETHDPLRQASNISHELAHALLIHVPHALKDEKGARVFPQEYEDEANWLGPALLISEEAALRIARLGKSMEEASRQYGASREVVQMRLNVCAAHKRRAA